MKNLFVIIALLCCLIGCGLDTPTEPRLTEEDVARIVAEELAKMNAAHDTLTPQEIAQIALKSTVYLRVKTASGNFYGSGFVIGDQLIATCDHVLEGMTSATVESVFNDKQYPVTKILAVSKKHDLAIVLALSYSAPPLPLGDSDDVGIGDAVFTCGNPLRYIGTFSHGIVTGIRDNDPLIADKVFQINVAVAVGSSGGPALNANGEVVGVIQGKDTRGQNLSFMIPINRLKSLLSTIR